MNAAGNTFPDTHWSVVLAAGRAPSPAADGALAELYQTYWYPLYAYARRSGHSPHDAEDLVQGFFAHMIETRLVWRAEAAKGRFRSFLLGAFKNYIASERRHGQVLSGKGGALVKSIDFEQAEARYGLEAWARASPDVLFDRKWALATVDAAFKLLEAEFKQSHRERLFDRLCPYLMGENGAPTYAEVARLLDTTEGTVKVTVSHMRARYRHLLRTVVLNTVADPSEADDELQYLRRVLRESSGGEVVERWHC